MSTQYLHRLCTTLRGLTPYDSAFLSRCLALTRNVCYVVTQVEDCGAFELRKDLKYAYEARLQSVSTMKVLGMANPQIGLSLHEMLGTLCENLLELTGVKENGALLEKSKQVPLEITGDIFKIH